MARGRQKLIIFVTTTMIRTSGVDSNFEMDKEGDEHAWRVVKRMKHGRKA